MSDKTNTIILDAAFEKEFPEWLKEGEKWAGETAVKWAEIQTFELSKEIITLNLGILAFQAAMNEKFHIVWLLISGIVTSMLSIIILFTFILNVSTANIYSANKRRKIIQDTIMRWSIMDKIEAYNYYNEHMSNAKNEMQGKEKTFNIMQTTGILLTMISIACTILGLFFYNTPHATSPSSSAYFINIV